MMTQTLPQGQDRATLTAELNQRLFATGALARLIADGIDTYREMDENQHRAIVGMLADSNAECLRLLDELDGGPLDA